jgi:hypothetical protein
MKVFKAPRPSKNNEESGRSSGFEAINLAASNSLARCPFFRLWGDFLWLDRIKKGDRGP